MDEELRLYCRCECCGKEIYEGDEYYEFKYFVQTFDYCAECVEDFKREAVIKED